jgi:hypothetical protein
MWAHFRHLSSKIFQWYKELLNPLSFDFYNHSIKIWESIWDSNSQDESSLGSVRVLSFTLFYTPRSMRCDSRASLLACTFVNHCFGREPKVRVVTMKVHSLTFILSHSQASFLLGPHPCLGHEPKVRVVTLPQKQKNENYLTLYKTTYVGGKFCMNPLWPKWKVFFSKIEIISIDILVVIPNNWPLSSMAQVY